MKTKKAIVTVLAVASCLIFYQPVIDKKKLTITGNECLPPHLRDKKHYDYTLPWMRGIPFWATSWCFEEPPIMILGNQNSWALSKKYQIGPMPIPKPGRWQLSIVVIKRGWPLTLPYFAFTTKAGFHFRIGCR